MNSWIFSTTINKRAARLLGTPEYTYWRTCKVFLPFWAGFKALFHFKGQRYIVGIKNSQKKNTFQIVFIIRQNLKYITWLCTSYRYVWQKTAHKIHCWYRRDYAHSIEKDLLLSKFVRLEPSTTNFLQFSKLLSTAPNDTCFLDFSFTPNFDDSPFLSQLT